MIPFEKSEAETRELGGYALPFVRPEKMHLLRSSKGTGVLRTSVPFLQEGFRYLRVVFLVVLLRL